MNKKDLQKFGITVGVVLSIISAILFYKGRGASTAFAVAGGLLLVAAAVKPAVLAPVYRAWMALAFALAWFNTRLILGVFFYLVFTPIGLIIRVFSGDLLHMKIKKDSESYWIPRERAQIDPERMERLF